MEHFDNLKNIQKLISQDASVATQAIKLAPFECDNGNNEHEFEENIISCSTLPTSTHTFEIPYMDDICVDKIMVNENNIEQVKLVINGSNIDTIYDCDTFSLLRECYNMEGLPFHIMKGGITLNESRRMNIIIRYKTPTYSEKLSYYYTKCQREDEISVYTHQYNYMNNVSSLRLPFNLSVVGFLIRTDIQCDEIILSILKYTPLKLTLNKIKEVNGYGLYLFNDEYEFGSNEGDRSEYTLNFSRTDDVTLIFPDRKERDVEIIAISINVTKENMLMFST